MMHSYLTTMHQRMAQSNIVSKYVCY